MFAGNKLKICAGASFEISSTLGENLQKIIIYLGTCELFLKYKQIHVDVFSDFQRLKYIQIVGIWVLAVFQNLIATYVKTFTVSLFFQTNAKCFLARQQQGIVGQDFFHVGRMPFQNSKTKVRRFIVRCIVSTIVLIPRLFSHADFDIY